jgi:hypothetical protein
MSSRLARATLSVSGQPELHTETCLQWKQGREEGRGKNQRKRKTIKNSNLKIIIFNNCI